MQRSSQRPINSTCEIKARNALARFFAGTLLGFAAFPCIQAFLVSPRSGTSHTLGLDEIALGLALGPSPKVADFRVRGRG